MSTQTLNSQVGLELTWLVKIQYVGTGRVQVEFSAHFIKMAGNVNMSPKLSGCVPMGQIFQHLWFLVEPIVTNSINVLIKASVTSGWFPKFPIWVVFMTMVQPIGFNQSHNSRCMLERTYDLV